MPMVRLVFAKSPLHSDIGTAPAGLFWKDVMENGSSGCKYTHPLRPRLVIIPDECPLYTRPSPIFGAVFPCTVECGGDSKCPEPVLRNRSLKPGSQWKRDSNKAKLITLANRVFDAHLHVGDRLQEQEAIKNLRSAGSGIRLPFRPNGKFEHQLALPFPVAVASVPRHPDSTNVAVKIGRPFSAAAPAQFSGRTMPHAVICESARQ